MAHFGKDDLPSSDRKGFEQKLALSKNLLTNHGDAEEFQAGRYDLYVNLPNVQVDPSRDGAVRSLLQEPVPDPAEVLLHRARAG